MILLRNLSNELVNELKGTAMGFETVGAVTEFQLTTVGKKTLFSGGCINSRRSQIISRQYL